MLGALVYLAQYVFHYDGINYTLNRELTFLGLAFDTLFKNIANDDLFQ